MYKLTCPLVITNPWFDRKTALHELRRCKANRVNLILYRELDYAFSSPASLDALRDNLAFFRTEGFETMVWLGESIGHDGAPRADRGKYAPLHIFDGGATRAFCPLGEVFRRDLANWVTEVARCGADAIILDDDYRLNYRGGLGCCCPAHMEKIEREVGETFASPEDFRQKAFAGGRNRYRDAWLKVQGESMVTLSRELRQALDEVNPAIRLGYCACVDSFDGSGHTAMEVAAALAGNTRPLVRLIGAPYWSENTDIWHAEKELGDVVEYERQEAAWFRRYMPEAELFSEGDSYPRPRFAVPAATMECFDTMLRASGENDGIQKYNVDYASNADYETGYVDMHVENAPLYEAIDRLFDGKTAAGVYPYVEMSQQWDTTRDYVRFWTEYPITNAATHFAVRTSLPLTYTDETAPLLLFGENARTVPLERLKNGAIVDLEAAQLLQERGVDVGVRGTDEWTGVPDLSFHSTTVEHFLTEDTHVGMGWSSPRVLHDDRAEVLSRVQHRGVWGTATYCYENAEGLRFLVLGHEARTFNRSFAQNYARRRQMMATLPWLSRRVFPAVVQGNHPFHYTLMKEDDRAVALGVWNLHKDRINRLRVTIGVPFISVNFVNCQGHMEGNDVVLDTTLYPYEMVGIEIIKA